MLDNIGFDLWAKYYDKSTEKSNDEYSYPFAGYYEILKIIYETVCEQKKRRLYLRCRLWNWYAN